MKPNRPTSHPAPASPLAEFSPVPLAARHDGFSAERQRIFVRGLAETGRVNVAAKLAGISREAAYRARRKPGAGAFAAAWDAALALAVEVISDLAMEHALEGEVIQTFYKGELISERIKRDTRLWMFLLAAHDPARYGRQPASTPPNRLKAAQKSYTAGLEVLRQSEARENSA